MSGSRRRRTTSQETLIVDRTTGVEEVRKAETDETTEVRHSAEHMLKTLHATSTERSLKTVSTTVRARASAAKTRARGGETTSRAMHNEGHGPDGDGI